MRDRSIEFRLNGKTPAFMNDLTKFVFVLTGSIFHKLDKSDGNRTFPIVLLFVRVYSPFKVLEENCRSFIIVKTHCFH